LNQKLKRELIACFSGEIFVFSEENEAETIRHSSVVSNGRMTLAFCEVPLKFAVCEAE
jgi:hypothetical protein